MTSAPQPQVKSGEVRRRAVQQEPSAATEIAKNDGNATENDSNKDKKTFGRTPDGDVFVVPTTHDMVSLLFDPRQPKNLSDAIVLAILLAHVVLAYALPPAWRRPTFALIFLFWRASYNVGIGLLLHRQSKHRRLITWAHRWKLFVNPETGDNPRPWLYRLLKRELEAKIAEDYEFEKAPIEYNTWLVFRRVVDLILMCDFVSYCLFAVICGHTPKGENIVVGLTRWVLGLGLVGFNLWVKLDAHRVVKDFAWYWGDFFYLIDQNLTFDSIYLACPSPMYSLGYAGFYGISMMAASYEVLFISIVAHAAQFAFLVIVENPHIEKTYNPPPKRSQASSQHVGTTAARSASNTEITVPSPPEGSTTSAKELPMPVHNLVGLQNLDLFRVPDCAAILLPAYLATLSLTTPNTSLWQSIFVLHALAWRVWYHLGLGILLDQQSQNKMWTRHFVKYGETAGEAWRQWKGLYHVSMVMCNASFVAACWKLYELPADWNYGLVLLKHVLGVSLIALQLWTAFSVYESLGEFGWFCGDFFFEPQAKLNYTSIYRFLNNPDRFFGIAGVWGAALITWSRAIFVMAIAAQCLTFVFIAYIERPHMQKIYGRGIRDEGSTTRFFKEALPSPVKALQASMDKVIDETAHFVEDFLDSARPRFTSGVKTIVRDTSVLFNTAPARLTLTRLPPEMAGIDSKQYSLSIETDDSSDPRHEPQILGKGRSHNDNVKTITYAYGSPLRVRWRAPANHKKADWIGLYKIIDNRSREKTDVSSLGRWAPTNAGIYDALTADCSIAASEQPTSEGSVTGEVLFAGDKLWWDQGVYEFRYHHNGNHTVMCISEPFEVRVAKFDEDDVDASSSSSDMYEKALESALLPVVQTCLDRNPEIAPQTVDESFGDYIERDGKYASRITYAIREMFGIEFAPAVVLADRNVRRLAWRIRNAKQVLAPYSLSHSKGTTTPVMHDELEEITEEVNTC